MRALLIAILICFSAEAWAGTVKANQETIIQTLSVILKKMERSEDKMDLLFQRTTTLEAWKENQFFNEQRFYEREWKENIKNMEAMSESIQELSGQLSTVKGVVISFMIIGSILSFMINAGLSIYLSRRSSSDIVLSRR